MQTKTKLLGIMAVALLVVVWLSFKPQKKAVDYVQLNDCYQKGYYDGRVAVYSAMKRDYVSRRYLDSTYSADSTRFNNWLKVYKR